MARPKGTIIVVGPGGAPLFYCRLGLPPSAHRFTGSIASHVDCDGKDFICGIVDFAKADRLALAQKKRRKKAREAGLRKNAV